MDYLTRYELITINEHMGAQNGGTYGVRDDGAIEVAVLRPQMGHYDSLTEKTAALMESIVMGEPFLSHNQRTAVAAADVFLRLNGFCLSVEPTEACTYLNARYFRKEFNVEILSEWLESGCISANDS